MSLVIPKKPHLCRLCGTIIPKGEKCEYWANVEPGEGWCSSYAHPECYEYTVINKWDHGDWECMSPGDIERPQIKKP